jgi:hypothetical protein
MKDEAKKEVKHQIEFTEEEVGVLKAAIQYYFMADGFGYALWCAHPGASVCSHDYEYRYLAGGINKKLNKVSNIKPEYGDWGYIKLIAELCREYLDVAVKEGEAAEQYMQEQAEKEDEKELIEELEREEEEKKRS